ncbi:MAG: hypothetical protein GY795_50840 [Desulfobacterales bacterium]|nr:hypothetical protein [Desulfobacterales bacterium]
MTNSWKDKLKDDPVPWLLESNPYTKYRTIIDLLELPTDSEIAIQAKHDLVNDIKIKEYIKEVKLWFPTSATRHNDPKLSHYKLRVLTDFGFTKDDNGIDEIITIVCGHVENGLFTLRQELPEKGKGFQKPNPDAEEWHALPCDSPLITYSMLRLDNLSNLVIYSADIIKEKWSDSKGWFCDFFFVNSMYKKLQMGCLMAGLMALEVFSQIPELKESVYSINAYEPIRFHREYGKTMYYFGRSKKFWALKYPFIWYNALYLAEVLSRFDFLKGDELLKEIIDWIESQQDEKGRFKPTSMFVPYKGWDFADKKEPSPWMTYLCCNILKRYYNENNA